MFKPVDMPFSELDDTVDIGEDNWIEEGVCDLIPTVDLTEDYYIWDEDGEM